MAAGSRSGALRRGLAQGPTLKTGLTGHRAVIHGEIICPLPGDWD